MIRCLHLADLHIGWEPSEPKASERREERDSLLNRAVNFALSSEGRADLMIIAGDLFETHRPQDRLVDMVKGELGRAVRSGMTVITVPGNHDEITYSDSVYRRHANSWPGILVTNPRPDTVLASEIRGIRVSVVSVAYTGGITTGSVLSDLPKVEGMGIGIFHASLDWDAGDRSMPMRSEDLARAGYVYVALGHIHQHRTARVGSGLAVYAGAVERKGFSDPGTGLFTLVELGGREPVVHRCPVAVRRTKAKTFDIGAYESVDSLVSAIVSEASKDDYLSLTLTGAAGWHMDPDALRDRLRGHWRDVEICDKTAFVPADLMDRYADDPTVTGFFVRRMRSRIGEAKDDSERRVAELALMRGLKALMGGGMR